MAAGKTTVGQMLAQHLGWKFIDLDKYIEEMERATVAEIFERSGQAVFRNSEMVALERVIKEADSPTLVALGGGAFTRKENQQLLRNASAFVIHMAASAEELWSRAHKDGAPERPMIRDRAGFETLLQSRLPEYKRADCEIVTEGKSPQQTQEEIEECLRSKQIL
jgi:shikimate kinase